MNLHRWLRYHVLGQTRHPAVPRKARRTAVLRSEPYLAWLRKQVCCCGCGRGPSEAAHTGDDGGMALKASDSSCVPLFWRCHRAYHALGRAGFERLHGIDLDIVAEGYFTEWSAGR